MKLVVLTFALSLALPAAAIAQNAEEVRNAPSADQDRRDEFVGAPLNRSDGMTGEDYQDEDLSRGVGNRLNQQQCIALGPYLAPDSDYSQGTEKSEGARLFVVPSWSDGGQTTHRVAAVSGLRARRGPPT